MEATRREPVMTFNDDDLVEVLDNLSKRTKVEIRVGNDVKAIEPADREWTYKTKPETTLLELLRDVLPREFENLDIKFQKDNVRVRTRTAGTAPAKGD